MSQQKAEEQVIENINKAFAEMDADGSGKVNCMELREFCKKVPGMESVSECLCEIDTSDDGQITLDELKDFILHKAPKDKIKESHLVHLFRQVDTSGDGRINKSELTVLLKQFNYEDDEITAMMNEVGGSDDMISQAEFITAFHSCQ